MARWQDVVQEAPEFAALARGFLDAHVHKTIATVRRDGSPRISGIEATVFEGDLWFGSLWQARKALDLRRAPTFALHSGSTDPPAWTGDAKVAGRARKITDETRFATVMAGIGGGAQPPGSAHLFRADLSEVVVVRVADSGDHLVIEWWRPGRGVERTERR